jgi:hypothetical protein
MNRKKIIRSLYLANAAVLVAAIAFLPRQLGYSFSYGSDLERRIKKLIAEALYGVPWGQVLAVLLISALLSVAAYLFATGVQESKLPSTDSSDRDENR